MACKGDMTTKELVEMKERQRRLKFDAAVLGVLTAQARVTTIRKEVDTLDALSINYARHSEIGVRYLALEVALAADKAAAGVDLVEAKDKLYAMMA